MTKMLMAITLPPAIVVLMLGIIIALTGIVYRQMMQKIESIEEETDTNSKYRLRKDD